MNTGVTITTPFDCAAPAANDNIVPADLRPATVADVMRTFGGIDFEGAQHVVCAEPTVRDIEEAYSWLARRGYLAIWRMHTKPRGMAAILEFALGKAVALAAVARLVVDQPAHALISDAAVDEPAAIVSGGAAE